MKSRDSKSPCLRLETKKKTINRILQGVLEGIGEHYFGASILLAGVRLDPSLPVAA